MGEMTFYKVLTWLIMLFQPVLERGRKAISELLFSLHESAANKL